MYWKISTLASANLDSEQIHSSMIAYSFSLSFGMNTSNVNALFNAIVNSVGSAKSLVRVNFVFTIEIRDESIQAIRGVLGVFRAWHDE